MSGRQSRDLGLRGERAMVRYLKANGYPDARRYLSGDGQQPGDIDFAPGVCLEVKNRTASAWPTWRAQCLEEAKGRLAIVARRTDTYENVGNWLAQVPMTDLLVPGAMDVWCPRTERYWYVAKFARILTALQDEGAVLV